MNNFVWNYEDLALSWQLWEALNISTLLNKLHSLITKSQEEGNISSSRSYSKRHQGLCFEGALVFLARMETKVIRPDSNPIFSMVYVSFVYPTVKLRSTFGYKTTLTFFFQNGPSSHNFISINDITIHRGKLKIYKTYRRSPSLQNSQPLTMSWLP